MVRTIIEEGNFLKIQLKLQYTLNRISMLTEWANDPDARTFKLQ